MKSFVHTKRRLSLTKYIALKKLMNEGRKKKNVLGSPSVIESELFVELGRVYKQCPP